MFEYNTISQESVDILRADMDKAAGGFWAYPDEAWQISFQSEWLMARSGVAWAFGPDGLLWGKRD